MSASLEGVDLPMDENKNTQGLYQALWNSADILRSKMDASEYKSYLLGLVFYKYLSDKMLYYVADVLEEPTNDVKKAYQIYDKAYNDNDLHEDLLANIQEEFSYCIAPDFTFTQMVDLETLKLQVRYMKTCLRM